MKDYIELGPTPCNEPCEQLGPNYDADKARAECRRYIDLIRKTLGPEPEGARLAVKSFAHDFGTYLEVVCHYDDTHEESVDYAFRCEAYAPANWEEIAMKPRYTLAIWIAGWSPPENSDLVHVSSKDDALERIEADQRHAERYGAGYAPPEAYLWHGFLDDMTDVYPDYVLEHGPRGRAYWQRA